MNTYEEVFSLKVRNYIHREKKALKPLHGEGLPYQKACFYERLLTSESGHLAKVEKLRYN